jgi:cytochrome b561
MSDVPTSAQAPIQQYNAIAKTFHWLMASLIACMLLLGLIMTTGDILDGPGKTVALHVHESVGMIVLGLGLLRLMWRFANPPPPFPAPMPRWERVAAHVTHVILYVLIMVMPLVGWMMISTMPHNALFFGMFPIPNLPVLPELPNKKDIREVLESIHGTLAWVIVGLVVLHAGAALKHHFLERDDVLLRMAPGWLGRILRYIRGDRCPGSSGQDDS